MAITGIGVQVITAKSGIGPQLPPPEPRNDNDGGDTGGSAADATKSAPAPGTGQLIDRTV